MRWGAVVAGGGVAIGMTTLGGGGTGAGGDATGSVTTLGGIIAAFTGGGYRMVRG